MAEIKGYGNAVYAQTINDMLAQTATLTERMFAQMYGENWREVMDKKKAKRDAEIAKQKANPKELTLDSLIEKLGWTREFAEHFVQPYCDCGTSGYEFDWDECQESPGGGRYV